MNKFLLNLILFLSVSSSLYSGITKDNIPVIYNNIDEAINDPMKLQDALQKIIEVSKTSLNENNIIDGIYALKEVYPRAGYFDQYFALQLDNSSSSSLTNQFFDMLKKFRKKRDAITNESLDLFGKINAKDIISNNVFNGDVFLLSQNKDGLALLLTFSHKEPKVILTLVRAEWDWNSSAWGEFKGFSYLSYDYDTKDRIIAKRYSYDKLFDKNEIWYAKY